MGIYEALTIIKMECEKHDDCTECPLRTESRIPRCSVSDGNTIPAEWKLRDPIIPARAFQD